MASLGDALEVPYDSGGILWGPLEPPGALGAPWGVLGGSLASFWVHLRSLWGAFWQHFLNHFGDHSFIDFGLHVGSILAPFWVPFGVIFA